MMFALAYLLFVTLLAQLRWFQCTILKLFARYAFGTFKAVVTQTQDLHRPFEEE